MAADSGRRRVPSLVDLDRAAPADVTGMLSTLPKHVPRLTILLDNMGAKPRQVARALGVSERSVYRWIAKDQAPRSVMLALFFCTTWGRSQLYCDTENAARMWAGLARSLMRERGLSMGDIEQPAANSPVQVERLTG